MADVVIKVGGESIRVTQRGAQGPRGFNGPDLTELAGPTGWDEIGTPDGALSDYIEAGFADAAAADAAQVAVARRQAQQRPLSSLLRGRRFRRTLGAMNGYTSAGTTSGAVVTPVRDYPFDPAFGPSPNILRQKAEQRRKVTSLAAPGSGSGNLLTVTCERRHGLAAGQRIRLGGATDTSTNSPNTANNEGLWGTDGGQGAKYSYSAVTPADAAAGYVAKGLFVDSVVDEFTFRTKLAASLAITDNNANLYWEPLPTWWPATDAVFDWVVPGRREALPRNTPAAVAPSFGTASTLEVGGSGATGSLNGQAKVLSVEFMLYEDLFVFANALGYFRIYADGVPVHNGRLNLNESGPGYRTTVEFKDARARLIRIESSSATYQADPANVYGIWTRGRDAIGPVRAKDQRRPLMLMCADSYGEGVGAINWHHAFAPLMAERLGWDVVHGSLGSTGLTTSGAQPAGNDYAGRMKLMKAGGVEPDLICVLNSVNDFGDVTTTNAAAFIRRLKGLWPNTEIIVLGRPYPSETIPTGSFTSDNAWLAVCQQFGIPFVDGGIGTLGKPVWITAGNKLTYYHGTQATGTATLGSGAVSSIAVGNAGAGYDPADGAPAVSFSGGGGSGAAATAVVNYKVTDIQIINGGRDYTTATLTIGHGAFATAVESSGQVVGIMVNNPGGVIFTTPPAITISGGGGSGATAEAVLEGGRLVAINVTAPGSGYSSPPSVTIGIASSAATATATITDGVITGVTITSQGSLYTDTPIVLVAGDGYGAELVPFISGTVTGVTVTNGGSGYSSPPTVTIAHPNGNDVTHPKSNGHRLLAHRYSAGIEQLLQEAA